MLTDPVLRLIVGVGLAGYDMMVLADALPDPAAAADVSAAVEAASFVLEAGAEKIYEK